MTTTPSSTPTPDEHIKLGKLLARAYEPGSESQPNKYDIRAAVLLLENDEFLALVNEVLMRKRRRENNDPRVFAARYGMGIRRMTGLYDTTHSGDSISDEGPQGLTDTTRGKDD